MAAWGLCGITGLLAASANLKMRVTFDGPPALFSRN
tara:strand:- start:1531 stop:1638 length:108 start_codon:yes stop_codon:yes gene_type:complete